MSERSIATALQGTWPAHRQAVIVGVFGCATLGLAPFVERGADGSWRPHFHIVKQLENVAHGTLTQGIDMVDLAMHGLPWLVLCAALSRWVWASRKG